MNTPPTDKAHSRPDYLALGHISKDLLPGGAALGGTVTYAALTAQKLGLQAAVVTTCAGEDRPLLRPLIAAGVWLEELPSQATTTFQNSYDVQGNRVQTIYSVAADIPYRGIPSAWLEIPIVHIGPVAGELAGSELTGRFPHALLGVTPQGWMRAWDAVGRVTSRAEPVPPQLRNLPANAALVLSIEDLGGDPRLMERYAQLAPIVVITRGSQAALVYVDGKCSEVPACRAEPVDPTGAGDVFAAAFFIHYRQTHDPIEAAHYAHAAAATAIGVGGIGAIEGRMK